MKLKASDWAAFVMLVGLVIIVYVGLVGWLPSCTVR